MNEDKDSGKNPNNKGPGFIEIAIWIGLLYFTFLFFRDLFNEDLSKKGPGYFWVIFVWIMLLPGLLFGNKENLEHWGFGWIFTFLKWLGLAILIVIIVSMCGEGSGLPDNIRSI